MIVATARIVGGLGARERTEQRTLTLEDGVTIAALLRLLTIDDETVGFVVVNGSLEHNRERRLTQGDVIELYPWMTGGA